MQLLLVSGESPPCYVHVLVYCADSGSVAICFMLYSRTVIQDACGAKVYGRRGGGYVIQYRLELYTNKKRVSPFVLCGTAPKLHYYYENRNMHTSL